MDQYDTSLVYRSYLFKLNALRKCGKFCNVTLKVNEKEIRAHRIVLVALSDYFQALLTSDFAEPKQSTIEIRGFEPEVVELIIDFAYTDEITFTRTNSLDLLTAADHFQILHLKYAVISYLESNICILNCFDVFVGADMLDLKKLRKICKSYILRNFQKLYQEEKLLNLSYNLLIEVASDDDLIVEKEESVFEAVFRWMDFKPNERKPHLDEVLETVRLDILNADFLYNVVGNHPMLIECDKVQNQIKDVLLSRSLSGRKSLATQSKHRKMAFDKFGLAMGIDKRIWFIASGNSITSYDFESHKTGPPRRPRLCYIESEPALATDGEYLFALGYVFKGEKYIPYLEIFDVTSKVCQHIVKFDPCVISPSYMMVSHKGKLYFKESGLNYLYIHNIEKRTNSCSSNMISVKYEQYRGICYFDSDIYIFGEPKINSQRYNISANTWELIDPIPLHGSLEIAVKDGKIFAKNKNEVMFYENNINRWFPCKLDASQIYEMNPSF